LLTRFGDHAMSVVTEWRDACLSSRVRTTAWIAATLVLASSIIAAPVAGNFISGQVEQAAAEPVGPGATGACVIRLQILLACSRFSPGEIDGRYGDDLAIAIKGYQENHELKPTGVADAATWKLLNSHNGLLLTSYTITAADVKGPFSKIPKQAAEQAKLKWMGYESPEEGLGEKFHMSPKLISELNPGKKLDTAGEQIIVANVARSPVRRASRVVISKSKRTVTAFGFGDKLLAQYPATVGGEHDPLPIGNWKIVGIVHNPWFNWDPVHFWNVDPKEAAEKLPPGPNNPVGLVWMGLSKTHYGIHGTEDPGQVRHGVSYGCIRLTNWDVVDLSHMVINGTPVIAEE
jgi:lipoprotein-anchoring transpeptidase ErfK/SrfK